MLKIKCISFLFLIAFYSSAHAVDSGDAVPSDASLKELFAITHSSNSTDRFLSQYDNWVRSMMQQALKGEPITPEQQTLIDAFHQKTLAICKEELAWDKMEPMVLKIYRDSFTQEEVNGLLAFYKTPAGQALIKKMPVVMQNTFAAIQARMGPIIQKTKKMVDETLADLKAQEMKNRKKK